MRPRLLVLVVMLIICGPGLIAQPAEASVDAPPSAAVVGRYVLYEDWYWIVQNKTVEDLVGEGYDLSDEYPSDWLLQVNYTREEYIFKCKILALSYPTVMLENVGGTYFSRVSFHRVLDDGTIGEKVSSFIRFNDFTQMHTWDAQNPDLGVMFNLSTFVIGHTFKTNNVEYRIDKTETLDTLWGENETYVLQGSITNSSLHVKNTIWCDAASGIILKMTWTSETPTYRSHEEMRTIETGVIDSDFEVTYGDDVSDTYSIDSTSPITVFVYDQATKEITLTVNGTMGTLGECKIPIPKEVVPDEHTFEVYIDGQKIDYELRDDEDAYLIRVEYQPNTHTLRISFVTVSWWAEWWLGLVAVATIIVGTGSFFAFKRKYRRTK